LRKNVDVGLDQLQAPGIAIWPAIAGLPQNARLSNGVPALLPDGRLGRQAFIHAVEVRGLVRSLERHELRKEDEAP